MQSEPHSINTVVWALPRSLAATYGIIVIFSSSGYLDVSVRRVPSAQLWIHCTVTCSACRVSPFRHPRINAYVQLPAAFRSLSRLSSAPSARASALRPTMLNLLYSSAPCIFRCRSLTVQNGSYTLPQANLRCVSFMFFSLACYCFLDLADLSTAHPSVLLVCFPDDFVADPRCTPVQLRSSPRPLKNILRSPNSSLVSSSFSCH